MIALLLMLFMFLMFDEINKQSEYSAPLSPLPAL